LPSHRCSGRLGAPQGPYPACDPAVAAHATFGSSGSPETDLSDTRLFATHPVTVAVGLPFSEHSQLVEGVSIQSPPGTAPTTNQDVMTGAGMDGFDGLTDAKTFVGDAAGTLPIRATWNQFDENGNNPCSSEATTSVTLASPLARLKLSKPKDTPGLGGDESRITLRIPRAGGDLRPLEIRYRAVRAQRFPGAGAKVRTIALAMRASDPGFRSNREKAVKAGGLEARTATPC
jgi:hypothetical protein